MSRYSDWTPDAIIAEIQVYRDAIRAVILGGQITQVAGEGRRMVMTGANIPEARTEIANLVAELGTRAGYSDYNINAISFEIG